MVRKKSVKKKREKKEKVQFNIFFVKINIILRFTQILTHFVNIYPVDFKIFILVHSLHIKLTFLL